MAIFRRWGRAPAGTLNERPGGARFALCRIGPGHEALSEVDGRHHRACRAGGGLLLAHTIWFKPLRIDWFFDRVLIEVALDNPQLLSQIGVLDGLGIRGHNARLTDGSEARELACSRSSRRDLATLRRYDRERLDAQRRLSYDLLEGFSSWH
jgi:hypothetical protein